MAELNESGEAGLLLSVSLNNFMCHSELKLNFGPHVNFVLGKNGSGKSSVVAAIIVALGGRISATGRDTNIKNIIQEGKQTATISVSLKNTGCDAFKEEVYGNVITVERKLTVDGSSSYKLKNEKGVVISTEEAELTSMLRAFNIQVHNPFAVLTQDVSKNFLNSNDAKDKYTLFFKATQLDVVQKDYKQVEEEIMSTQNILECREQVLPRLKNEIRELEKKSREYVSLERQKDQLAKLYEEFAWSIVIEREYCVAELHLLVEKIEKSASGLKKCIELLEAEYQKALTRETDFKNRITAAQAETNNIRKQKMSFFFKKGYCRQQMREIQNSIQELNMAIAMNEEQISYLSKSIDEALSNTQEDPERRKAERDAKLHQHLKRVERLKSVIQSYESKLAQMKEVCDHFRNELTACKDEEEALQYTIEATEQEIVRIRQCQSNSILAYGNEMPELLKQIRESSRRFRHVPKGPLGRYVKVKDDKWALAVECCLGLNLLHSFLCDNDHDRNVLYSIMNSLYPGKTPQVITSKFGSEVYDVSSGQVESSRFHTVLEMLDISDPDIMNCLIDQRGIETIILIPTNDEARNVMLSQPPRRCSEAYTLEGASVCPIPDFRFYANKKKTVSLISNPENLDLNISEKTRELVSLNQALRECQDKVRSVGSRVASEERNMKPYEMSVSHFQNVLLKESAEIEGLEVSEEPTGDVPSLQNELEKEQLLLGNSLSSKNQKEHALKSHVADLKKLESEEVQLRDLREKKNSEVASLSEAAATARQRSLDSLKEKNKKEVCYKEELKKLEVARHELAKQRAVVKEKEAEAEKVCPRIETRRKPQSIDLLIEQTKESIAKGSENEENIEDIIELHEAKRRKYEELGEEIKNLKTVLRSSNDCLKKQLQAFKDLRTHVGCRVQYLFSANLHTRGYIGTLKIDHEEETLDICAQPNHSSSMQNRKVLSGGEKSFITVALLLSLWDAIVIPFRILDAYDIYMDELNRKHTMDLMVASALEHCANQFIFLSPREQVQIPSSKEIQIMHMPDPQRQRTLNEEERMDVD